MSVELVLVSISVHHMKHVYVLLGTFRHQQLAVAAGCDLYKHPG